MATINSASVRRVGLKHVLKVLGISSILLEINPLTSEPLRLAVLFGTEAATHSALLSAIAFGGITLIWELVCVIAAADLLDGKTSKKIIAHVRNTIGKVGLNKLMHHKTNLLTDFAITLVAGSPATVILKHLQEPGRSPEENRNLGYMMSIGAALIATLQGAAIVEGLWHPNIVTLSFAAVIVIGSMAAYYLLKRYLATSS